MALLLHAPPAHAAASTRMGPPMGPPAAAPLRGCRKRVVELDSKLKVALADKVAASQVR